MTSDAFADKTSMAHTDAELATAVFEYERALTIIRQAERNALQILRNSGKHPLGFYCPFSIADDHDCSKPTQHCGCNIDYGYWRSSLKKQEFILAASP